MKHLHQTWPNALRGDERLILLARFANRPHVDTSLAQRRWQRWDEALTKDDWVSLLSRRLEASAIDSDDFLAMLGADPLDLAASESAPLWATELLDWIDAPSAQDQTLATLDDTLGEWRVSGFAMLYRQIVANAMQRAVESLESSHSPTAVPFDPLAMVGQLVGPVARLAEMMISRSLVVEMHASALDGNLHGDSSEDRYRDFVSRLGRAEYAKEIFAIYPVLARQLHQMLSGWEAGTTLFLERLVADWAQIRTDLNDGEDPGPVVKIEAGAGDAHGGQSVTVVTTATGWKVVYKPRSVVVERHVHEVLDQVHAWGAGQSFLRWRVLDCGTHGWVEFVEPKPCGSHAELELHYERVGQLLAVLYVLGGTDVHRENLIAHADHPVLVDLETLLAPEPQRLQDLESPFLREIEDTVLNTLLLPERSGSGEFDDGGVGDGDVVQSANLPLLIDSGTDRARIERVEIEVPLSDNVPSLDGTSARAVEFVPSILNGFRQTYVELSRHANQLSDPEGILKNLRTAELRSVLRDTQTYSLILNEADHPHLLTDALERDRHIDSLWLALDEAPFVSAIGPFEVADLHRRDIPIFQCTATSTSAWSTHGHEIENIFALSGWDRLLERLHRMGDRDLEHQLFLIAAAFLGAVGDLHLTASSGDHDLLRVRPPLTAAVAAPVTNQDIVAVSELVVERLSQTAIVRDDRCRWYGIEERSDGTAAVGIVSADLYAGLGGISVYLAEHHRLGGGATDLLQWSVDGFVDQVTEYGAKLEVAGGYTGWGGLLWSANRLNELGWLPERADLSQWIGWSDAVINQDKWADATQGVTGLGLAGLALNGEHTNAGIDLARRCGTHLASLAVDGPTGAVWATTGEPISPANPPLAGFAHGAAAIALFFARLAVATEDEQWVHYANDALNYEHSKFDEEEGNWPDLRVLPESYEAMLGDGLRFPLAWCHGAPGIAVSRLAILDAARGNDVLSSLDLDRLEQDLRVAVETTINGGFGGSHCLCHGDLGNLDAVAAAGYYFGDQRILDFVGKQRSYIVNEIASGRASAGLPLGVIEPGLMTGLSGIGLGLLRLADPENTSDVLTLSATAHSSGPLVAEVSPESP